MKKTLILGVNGQDGSYLAEFLLENNYQVFGWIPDGIPVSFENIQHLLERIELVEGDLNDQDGLIAIIDRIKPDEIYNLASPSSPTKSWDAVVNVGNITGLGAARILEAIRSVHPSARFYQASTSELFGHPVEVPQNEKTPFNPRNPYGIAKLFAHWTAVRYRERFGIFALSGILFNHESPRRGIDFVTRKITLNAAKIKHGITDKLYLGNLNAKRDWGYAGDYVKAMWLMMQQEIPQDFVIGTGETHSVKELCELAFGYLDLDYKEYVVQDPELFRPPEEQQLVANYGKAERVLGWRPNVTFPELIELMVHADLKLLKQ